MRGRPRGPGPHRPRGPQPISWGTGCPPAPWAWAPPGRVCSAIPWCPWRGNWPLCWCVSAALPAACSPSMLHRCCPGTSGWGALPWPGPWAWWCPGPRAASASLRRPCCCAWAAWCRKRPYWPLPLAIAWSPPWPTCWGPLRRNWISGWAPAVEKPAFGLSLRLGDQIFCIGPDVLRELRSRAGPHIQGCSPMARAPSSNRHQR